MRHDLDTPGASNNPSRFLDCWLPIVLQCYLGTTYSEQTQGRNVDLLFENEVSNSKRGRSNIWRSAFSQGMLSSGTGFKRKPHVGSGRRTKGVIPIAGGGEPSRRGHNQSNKSRDRTWPHLEGQDCRVPQTKPRCLCLDSQRYAGDRQWSDRA